MIRILRASLQLLRVARINRAMGAIRAVAVVATAESSCKGGLIRGCSARVSAAQSKRIRAWLSITSQTSI